MRVSTGVTEKGNRGKSGFLSDERGVAVYLSRDSLVDFSRVKWLSFIKTQQTFICVDNKKKTEFYL